MRPFFLVTKAHRWRAGIYTSDIRTHTPNSSYNLTWKWNVSNGRPDAQGRIA